MEEIAKAELCWVKGYNGSKARYIDKNTVVYACGNNISFMKEDGQNTVFTSPGEGVSVLDVHQLNKDFAFAELCLNPRVFVFKYPDMEKVAELSGGAKLEYTNLAFSCSDFLVTISGVPDFQLTLWNYLNGQSLMSVPISDSMSITGLSFNPANWRQICMCTTASVIVYTVEQSDTKYDSCTKPLQLSVGEKDTATAGANAAASVQLDGGVTLHKLEMELIPSAIAGLVEPQADIFERYKDPRMKCIPASHTWTPAGDIIIGCTFGQLLRIDGESWMVKPIFIPGQGQKPHLTTTDLSLTKGTSLLSKDMSILEEEDSTLTESATGGGSIDCMILHKNGLYVGGKDGVLRCLNISKDNIKLVDSHNVGEPITYLDFSTNWSHLNIGSSSGVMYTYDVNSPGKTTVFLSEHSGNFVEVQCLSPGLDHAVTLRERGELQVWSLVDGVLAGTMNLSIEATAMACSPVAPVVVVGSATGFLFVIDLSDLEKGRIIHRCRAYSEPITNIRYSEQGSVIFLGSASGHVIMASGYAHQQFKMLCYTDVDGAVETITAHTTNSKDIHVVVTSNNTHDPSHGANKCTVFQLTQAVLSDIEQHYCSLKADIKDESINKLVFNFASPSYGACLISLDYLYTLAQDNKMMQKLAIPKEKPKKPNSKDSYLVPEVEFPSHQLPGGKIYLSPHQKWLSSVGADGKLQIRTLESSESALEVHPHDYRHKGARSICWSASSEHLLTVGREDGILTCYSLRYTESGEQQGKMAETSAKQRKSLLSDVMMKERDAVRGMQEFTPEASKLTMETTHSTASNIEQAINEDQIYKTPTPVPKLNSTWLEARQLLAHSEEDKAYSEVKKDLRLEIREIRRTLLGLMDKNKTVPDIEKLQHNDFDLDVDEQQRLQAIGDAEVQRIRDAMEFENLAKQYLTHLIKVECWDSMEVKGRSIEGFDINLEVENYPMKKRSKEDIEELAKATAIRRIEIAEQKARAEMVEIAVPKPSQQAVTDEEGDEDEVLEGEAPSVTGSMGSLYGGKNELFYNQFELYNREQKVLQIILLKDAIYRIKQAFNKEFNEVLTKKEQELSKISDKNKRMAKIYNDLSITDTIRTHKLSSKEKPELLLTVDDDEVTVEKYLTPEQRKAKEEWEKAEEERRLREQGDNARERALEQMMGGVLEIKKEDELKKDVPIPSFIQNKEQSDWSEEEQKLFKDFERKVKELNEEREKYKKQLEAELKKLQQLISEAEQSFNDQLKALFSRKLKVEMVICQEELKVLRLQYGMMFESALVMREKQLTQKLEHKKELKVLAAEAYIVARKNVDSFKEGYDILVAEDKVMDKGFKREFSDLPALQYELLYKLFRKRPRATKTLHNRGETPILDTNSGNPFAERPSTARVNMMQKQGLEAALTELDKPVNMPEGVDEMAWSRLIQYRRTKIDSELLIKQKALVMAEMMSFQQKRLDEDYKLAEEIDDLSQEISKLKEAMQQHHINLQVQLLLKQGQVEVEPVGSYIHDYKDSVLIHRGVVEDLNGKIKTLGESKIASMVESKDFRKGIIQLEWEHRKNMMKIEDLKEKMRVVNMMKVTREIQSYLTEIDHDAKIAQELSILEQTILLQKKHHESSVEAKKKMVKDLRHLIREKELENSLLEQEIQELNVTVNEREHIHESSADKNTELIREKRYQQIVQRRKLVDLAKAQANEVAVLRAEVERLRMRTFPALVQVER